MNRILFLLFLATSSVFAQYGEPTPTPDPAVKGFWSAQMPAGKYVVRLASITSISMHEYLADGATRISELTIATAGSEIARFYFIAANLPQTPGGVGQGTLGMLQDRAQQVVSKVGAGGVWSEVVKNYPTTTHAHTVEYRVNSREELENIFKSIETAMTTGRGGTFKP